jgi:hypothetical protein
VLERLRGLHPNAIDLSLDRIQRLLAALGAPQGRLPPVVHVAGTNGKGSTLAFLRAMLEAAGHRIHVYTSPHLVHFREQIRLGRPGAGALIDDDGLIALLEECEAANVGRSLTLFEITTAAAFLAFARTPADAVLLETGLGGSTPPMSSNARRSPPSPGFHTITPTLSAPRWPPSPGKRPASSGPACRWYWPPNRPPKPPPPCAATPGRWRHRSSTGRSKRKPPAASGSRASGGLCPCRPRA